MDTHVLPICENPSRRAARRHSRREAILDVAERSFLEQGYAATTMSAIAAELGGSKGTLWSYFPDKDLLFAAVIERLTDVFQQQLTLLLNPADDPEATLLRFARSFLQRVTSPPSLALYRLMMAEVNRSPETGPIFDGRALGRTQAQVSAYLAIVMASGRLRDDDPQLAAQQLVALCLSGCHRMLIIRLIDAADAEMIEKDATTTVATFMRAYGGCAGGRAEEFLNPPQ